MKVYLDNAATTPLAPEVLEAMLPYLNQFYGNPSSIHSFGRDVRVKLEEARETVAGFINADPSEIYFTSGGTESINFILKELVKTEYSESGKNSILTSSIEHHAVLETLDNLDNEGFKVCKITPNEDGSLDKSSLKGHISDNISLYCFMHVNNETGSVTSIAELAELSGRNNSYFFTDTVQSFGKFRLDVREMGINALAGSAHKIYGPKGVGFAYVKSGTPLSTFIHGGSQERNRRGGTENVAGIIGLAEAVRIASGEMDNSFEHISGLRKILREGIKNIDNEGLFITESENNSPYILSLTFKSDYYNNDPEAMLIYLDINGIAASNGSACTSGTLKVSHVLTGMGKKREDAAGTIRFSLGKFNTSKEMEYTLEVLEKMSKKFSKYSGS